MITAPAFNSFVSSKVAIVGAREPNSPTSLREKFTTNPTPSFCRTDESDEPMRKVCPLIVRVTDTSNRLMSSHGIHPTIDRSTDMQIKPRLVPSHPVGRSDQIESQLRAIVPPVRKQQRSRAHSRNKVSPTLHVRRIVGGKRGNASA